MLRALSACLPIEAARRMHVAALALVFGLFAVPTFAARTDVVVLINGDHITGEVHELAHGQLKVKTDYMGTLYIDWTKIASLTTNQRLHVGLSDGRRFYGPAPEPASKEAAIRLLSGQRDQAPIPVEVSISDVVELERLKGGDVWFDRLEGAVSAGYSYVPSSSVDVFSFSANVGRRNVVRHWNLSLDAQTSHQAAGPSTQRATLVTSFERYLPNLYFNEASVQFARNEDLGLDARSLIGDTLGRYLVKRPGLEWRIGAGLAASAETGSDGSHRRSLEGQLITDLRVFRFDHPKTDVTASLNLLPSISEGGRLRGEASIKVNHELFSDVFFQVSFSDSYDNRPAETGRVNDYSVTTSLGYSF
jgi:uncharacterized protein DUF481